MLCDMGTGNWELNVFHNILPAVRCILPVKEPNTEHNLNLIIISVIRGISNIKQHSMMSILLSPSQVVEL